MCFGEAVTDSALSQSTGPPGAAQRHPGGPARRSPWSCWRTAFPKLAWPGGGSRRWPRPATAFWRPTSGVRRLVVPEAVAAYDITP